MTWEIVANLPLKKENENIINKKTKLEFEQKIDINDALKQVYEKLKHTQTPNKRIETEFKKLLPQYSAVYDVHCGSLYTFAVWGNGLDYNNRYYLCSNVSKGWEGIRESLEIMDNRDSLENLIKEEKYYQKLAKYQEQIKEIREKVKALKNGYIPKTATVRKAEHFWDNFSYTTKKNFSELFDYKD